jgi:hypothetical protein
MKHVIKAVIVAALMAVSWLSPLHAQDDSQDYLKFNSNIGMPISVPLHPTSQFADVGVGVVYGAGYNFTRRQGVTGEFMWNWLNPSGQTALQDTGIGGDSNLFSLTGNYRFERRGKRFGTYFIGGAGWYYHASGALGGNAGIGFTVRVGEEPYRFYVEPRYHYASNENVTTQLLTVTVGFRY